MMPNRRLGAIALALVLLAAGCGGSATSAPSGDPGSGNGDTPAPTVDPGSGDTPAPTSNSGNLSDDALKVGESLAPPNSTEILRTTTDTYWYVGYESTDSTDSLKSFYERRFGEVGLQVISTTEASGSISWVVARDETGSFGGAVTLAPSGSGSGSTVVVAIGSE